LKLIGRLLSQAVRFLTGIEIHPGAIIGQGLFIDHGMGVVIGETAEIGNEVTLYHGVTLGGTSLKKGKRHPTLGDRVVVGAGAKILGAITISGDTHEPMRGGQVGAGESLLWQRAERSRSNPAHADAPDLDHTALPDLVGVSLIDLMERVEALEEKLDGREAEKHHIHAPTDGTWHGEDFSI
jgi:serine O-acetyltransferase